MRALVKTAEGMGGLALIDRPEPALGPGQVKIKVQAAGICSTDLAIYRGKWPVKVPQTLGHEIAGVIAAIGPEVTGLHLGERVTTETDAYTCGVCGYCTSGREYLCPRRTAMGTSADGGMADYLLAPAGGIHHLPAGLSPAAGAMIEPLAVAVHLVLDRTAVQPGESVAIIGPGTIGLLAAQVVRAAGAVPILLGLDRHAPRFQLARELGIAHTYSMQDPHCLESIRCMDSGLGPHKVIECSGAPGMAQTALKIVRKGGTLGLVAFYYRPIRLDLDLLINKEVTVTPARGKQHACWPRALELVQRGQVNTERLITHHYPLEMWKQAFRTALASGTKVMLDIEPRQADP